MLARLVQAGVDEGTIQLTSEFGTQFSVPPHAPWIASCQDAQVRPSGRFFFYWSGFSVVPRLLARSQGGVSFTVITCVRLIYEAPKSQTGRGSGDRCNSSDYDVAPARGEMANSALTTMPTTVLAVTCFEPIKSQPGFHIVSPPLVNV